MYTSSSYTARFARREASYATISDAINTSFARRSGFVSRTIITLVLLGLAAANPIANLYDNDVFDALLIVLSAFGEV